jgi:spore coat protein U-like protein
MNKVIKKDMDRFFTDLSVLKWLHNFFKLMACSKHTQALKQKIHRRIDWMFYFIFFISLLIPLESGAVVCSVSSVPVNFGSYDVYASGNTQTIGQVTVTCDPVTTSYTVALNGGTYGTIAQRKQSSGSDFLLYNLYTDPARSILWGDGSTNGVTVSSSSPNPLNVYGSIPGQQDVSEGTYTDHVSVMVTF